MAITTSGFQVAPSGGPVFQGVQPKPLQFLDPRTFVVDSGADAFQQSFQSGQLSANRGVAAAAGAFDLAAKVQAMPYERAALMAKAQKEAVDTQVALASLPEKAANARKATAEADEKELENRNKSALAPLALKLKEIEAANAQPKADADLAEKAANAKKAEASIEAEKAQAREATARAADLEQQLSSRGNLSNLAKALVPNPDGSVSVAPTTAAPAGTGLPSVKPVDSTGPSVSPTVNRAAEAAQTPLPLQDTRPGFSVAPNPAGLDANSAPVSLTPASDQASQATPPAFVPAKPTGPLSDVGPINQPVKSVTGETAVDAPATGSSGRPANEAWRREGSSTYLGKDPVELGTKNYFDQKRVMDGLVPDGGLEPVPGVDGVYMAKRMKPDPDRQSAIDDGLKLGVNRNTFPAGPEGDKQFREQVTKAARLKNEDIGDKAFKQNAPELYRQLVQLEEVINRSGTSEGIPLSSIPFADIPNMAIPYVTNEADMGRLSQIPYTTAILAAKTFDPRSAAMEGERKAAQKYMVTLGPTASKQAALTQIQDLKNQVLRRARDFQQTTGISIADMLPEDARAKLNAGGALPGDETAPKPTAKPAQAVIPVVPADQVHSVSPTIKFIKGTDGKTYKNPNYKGQ